MPLFALDSQVFGVNLGPVFGPVFLDDFET